MKTSYNERDPRPRVDWGDALTIPHFYGRKEEQTILAQWVTQEDCRVVSVLGMGGIGKSALSVNVMHQLVDGPRRDRGKPLSLRPLSASPQPLSVQGRHLSLAP